jgi:DNA-binding NtrC family response regulator
VAKADGTRSRPSLEGKSPKMEQLRELIAKAAPTNWPVLILGERGSGKELVAYELYSSSGRADKKLLTQNLGAVDSGTANSELFGHVRHAFTGALADRLGHFRTANGGTLFLDEIGNATLDLQGKLLRAIEYGEVTPVGSDVPIEVDVRVIAATNSDLDLLASDGKFRSDLIDRFTIRIQVPPLRECGDDCLFLARKYLRDEARKEKNIESICFTLEAEQLIRNHNWPGNVREVINRVRSALLIAPHGAHDWQVQAGHLGSDLVMASRSTAFPGIPQSESRQETLADLVLDGLLSANSVPLLDPFHDLEELKCVATRYIVEQLEIGLAQFMEMEVGKTMLRSKPNSAILAERFNLARKTDSRKKSFARVIRDRLNLVLERCRGNLGVERGAGRRGRVD